MFVETITAPEAEWRQWTERLRLLSDPPAALVATIAWKAQEGQVSAVNVWDSPDAVSEFFVERVHQIVADEGAPAVKPTRHGDAVAIYLRR